MKQVEKNYFLIVKTLVFLMLAPGTVTVVLPYMIVKNDPLGTIIQPLFPHNLGLFPLLAGLTICLWCFWDFIIKGEGTPSPFDPPKQLVVAGLYRYVRNPMYIGIVLVILGEAVICSSVPLTFYLIILIVFFHISVVYYEEPKLKSEFGEKYDNYLFSVPRWSLMFKQKKLPPAKPNVF